MRKIYPTELIDFLQCRHMAYLKKSGVQGESTLSEEIELLRQKGLEHEENYLQSLEGEVVKIDPDAPLEEQSRQTRDAMSEGKDYIYQGYLENDRLAGYPDFLEKTKSPSSLGDFSYKILDTKLSNVPSAANAVQLIHYSVIAEEIQGSEIQNLQVIHGNSTQSEICKADYLDYYNELLNEYETFLKVDEKTEPFPISSCKSCSYLNHCNKFWGESDHIARINRIKQADLEKLQALEISTMEKLSSANWEEGNGFSRNQFNELKLQAQAQKNNEILLKDRVAFESMKQLARGGVILNIFQNFLAVDGAKSFHFSLKTLGGERFEELFVSNSSEELNSFKRIISFVMRYLDKKPNSFVMVWSSSDIKFIHDLSNKYNVCHDEVDSLIFNKKLVAIKSIIQSALYLPVQDSQLSSVYGILSTDAEMKKKLKTSPQLLNELQITKSLESAEKQISARASAELSAVEAVVNKLVEYEIDSFPVKLYIDED